MTTLARWNPYTEQSTMQYNIDRIFDSFWSDWNVSPIGNGFAQHTFDIDLSEKDDEYVIKATLPGLKPEEIDIAIHDDVLTISGETKHENQREEQQYVTRERSYGSFMRRIVLPTPIHDSTADATLNNGVLTIRLPKSGESKSRVRHLKVEKNGQHGKLNLIERLKSALPLPKREKSK